MEQSCGCQPTTLRGWAMARQGGPLLNHQRQGSQYLSGSVGFAATRRRRAAMHRYPVPHTPFLAPDHAPPTSRLGAKEDPPCRTNEMVPGRRRALAALPPPLPAGLVLRRQPTTPSTSTIRHFGSMSTMQLAVGSWQLVCPRLEHRDQARAVVGRGAPKTRLPWPVRSVTSPEFSPASDES